MGKELKRGYCTEHGYDWCKCLEAMDELDKTWEKIFNAKDKSQTAKRSSASASRSKAPRVSRKKNLPND